MLKEKIAKNFMPLGLVFLVSAIIFLLVFTPGCSKAEYQSREISRQADNFETPRKLTIVNTRTDKIIVELIGTFSVQRSDGELDILCAIGDDKYEKDFFGLNEWTIYSVEDCKNTDVKLYDRIIRYYPEN